MGRDLNYLVDRVRAFCERFHPYKVWVNFQEFSFFLHMDGALSIALLASWGCERDVLWVECDGSMTENDPGGVLFGWLLPQLESALILDDLAGV